MDWRAASHSGAWVWDGLGFKGVGVHLGLWVYEFIGFSRVWRCKFGFTAGFVRSGYI